MILITGATGTIGSELVKQIARRPNVRVRALVRSPKKAEAAEGANVEFVRGDFNEPATLDRALEGVERVFLLSAPGPEQPELEGNLIEAAQRAAASGVKHIVKLSAMGAAADSPFTLCRTHGQIERRVEESGLAFTHLRPNSFMQNLLGFAPTIRAEGVFYAPVSDGRVSLIDARDIAAVAAAVLTEPGHENRAYTITGPEALTYAEVADKLSDAIGKPIAFVSVPPDAARQGMLGAGFSEWLADALNELYAGWDEGLGAEVTTVVNDVAKKEPFTFERFARDYAPAFKE